MIWPTARSPSCGSRRRSHSEGDREHDHQPGRCDRCGSRFPVCAPAAALIDASRDAALVVVGHRGLGGFTGLLVGSVGVQTAAHAACPVVVVRDSPSGASDEAGPATGQVVVGVDGSDLSNLAVDFAFAHAALHRLGVVAVHAHQWRIGSYYTDYLYQWPTRLLAEAVAECRAKYPDVPVQQKVVQGESADVLIAESAGAALTVVGSRGRGGFTGLLLGSTSQRVLHHATGTVAIVRAQATHGGGTSRPRQGVSDAPEPAQVATGPTAPAAPRPTVAAQRWFGNGGKDVVCVIARAETGHVALIYDTLGLRGNDLRRLTFRDVRVPKENVLGEPGDGQGTVVQSEPLVIAREDR
ncbi:MAG TPA: universal stress protein, partial [Nonomuraea sp.]|nr:universal stress protein [Nonomuraea sp.]